jgi:hypothetical protein
MSRIQQLISFYDDTIKEEEDEEEVEADSSLTEYSSRNSLTRSSTAALTNVCLHRTGSNSLGEVSNSSGSKPSVAPKPRLSAQQLENIAVRRKSLQSGVPILDFPENIESHLAGDSNFDPVVVALRTRKRKTAARRQLTRKNEDEVEVLEDVSVSWRLSMGIWHENVVRCSSAALSAGFMPKLG